MVHALKILLNVALEYVAVLSCILAVSVYRGMGALAFAARIRVVDKGTVKEWFYDVTEGMVNHPVAVRSSADQTLFWIIDEKIAVAPVSVGLFFEFPLQSK